MIAGTIGRASWLGRRYERPAGVGQAARFLQSWPLVAVAAARQAVPVLLNIRPGRKSPSTKVQKSAPLPTAVLIARRHWQRDGPQLKRGQMLAVLGGKGRTMAVVNLPKLPRYQTRILLAICRCSSKPLSGPHYAHFLFLLIYPDGKFARVFPILRPPPRRSKWS